jgi:hypothetical protein
LPSGGLSGKVVHAGAAFEPADVRELLCVRVSDGTRTRDRLDHNQELYQLSYAHHAPPSRATFGI